MKMKMKIKKSVNKKNSILNIFNIKKNNNIKNLFLFVILYFLLLKIYKTFKSYQKKTENFITQNSPFINRIEGTLDI